MAVVETLRVIHFDRFRAVLDIAEYVGEATCVILPIRHVIAEALRLRSAGLLLSHNHPSGDPTPSPADIAATRRLVRAAAALDIRVHDHLVIGNGKRISFRATGLL
jgi:DNA repair protein RadC